LASWSARMRARIFSSVACSSGGRNSCNGGASGRVVPGGPAPPPREAPQSLCWRGRSRSSAARGARARAARGVAWTAAGRARAAEADPLGAELPRSGRVLGRVGVRAHGEAAEAVRPPEDRLEVLVQPGLHEGHLARVHASGRPVDGEHVALAQLVAADPDEAAV